MAVVSGHRSAVIVDVAFTPGLVDRMLAVAAWCRVEALVVVNKMDLVEEPPPEAATYRDLGVPLLLVSAARGKDISWLFAVHQVKAQGINVRRYSHQGRVYRYALDVATRSVQDELLLDWLTTGFSEEFAAALRPGSLVRITGRVKNTDYGYVTALIVELEDGYKVTAP